MANQEYVELLKRDVTAWNAWRAQHLEIFPNLRDADLSHTDLRRINLRDADLRDADLSHANLSYADLRSAHLNNANLSHADLINADLSHVNLHNADLSNSDLRDANLSIANLSNVNLYGAHVLHTVFYQVDLREARGLIDIVHDGPSIVALNMIMLPPDGSALHFLRGAGFWDEWIDFYRTTMMHPIQYHSCFISYSSKDETLAKRLHADLQAQGVRCWFAPEDMKIGDKIRPRIDEAIHLQEKLLLLLSEHSIASSWVEAEVEAALEKEDQQKRAVLFPIRLDESVMHTSQAWAATLRRMRHIGDFMRWADPHAYQQAFDRLLRDLKK
jgi:hypothetical protein